MNYAILVLNNKSSSATVCPTTPETILVLIITDLLIMVHGSGFMATMTMSTGLLGCLTK